MLSIWEFTYTTWPAVPQTVSASVFFNTTNTSGINKALTLQVQGSTSTYQTSYAVATSPTSVTLPISPVNFIAIHNIGNFPFTVTWTPYLGAANVVKTIQPNGFIVEGDSAIGSGVTSLSLQAVGAASTAEFYLLG
jgi:hypothetical protein